MILSPLLHVLYYFTDLMYIVVLWRVLLAMHFFLFLCNVIMKTIVELCFYVTRFWMSDTPQSFSFSHVLDIIFFLPKCGFILFNLLIGFLWNIGRHILCCVVSALVWNLKSCLCLNCIQRSKLGQYSCFHP